ncbi:hypothetical protein PR001_g30363 [Phytophthora rubi]|uniref:Uncharacterized protein n=2 Tax=Phytophthora rubi TaxID=129364 RepID=A0A6A3GQY7_9STRA|nr:hypothetical protein PR002_g30530 [Phytophthora rubi]KAE8960506.1 hypothetical protein PR001_g30363 [Phytophthora rubi]
MLAKLDLVVDLLELVVTSPLLVGMSLVSLEVKLPVLEVTLLELTFLVEWLVPYLELDFVLFLPAVAVEMSWMALIELILKGWLVLLRAIMLRVKQSCMVYRQPMLR